MERQEIDGEIAACKNILDQTDYQILRAVEDIFAAEDAVALLRAIADAGKVVKDTIRQRKKMRDRINELEAMTAENDEQAAEEQPSEPEEDAE